MPVEIVKYYKHFNTYIIIFDVSMILFNVTFSRLSTMNKKPKYKLSARNVARRPVSMKNSSLKPERVNSSTTQNWRNTFSVSPRKLVSKTKPVNYSLKWSKPRLVEISHLQICKKLHKNVQPSKDPHQNRPPLMSWNATLKPLVPRFLSLKYYAVN